MKPFIRYQDGTVENSYLCHMFYIASIGFTIVPGMFTANGIPINYESTPDGIKMMRPDGECMVLPFRQAMHMVSKPITPEIEDDGHVPLEVCIDLHASAGVRSVGCSRRRSNHYADGDGLAMLLPTFSNSCSPYIPASL